MAASQYIRLVTADPRRAATRPAATGCGGQAGGTLLFFYMDGVLAADPACRPATSCWWDDWAAAGALLKLCRSAWERRRSVPPSPPFALASLTDLALAAEQAVALECSGDGPGSTSTVAAGRENGPFGLLVASDPVYDPYDEVVDLALAFALLDLPLAVIFRGRGLFHLLRGDGEAAGRWRTLVDLTAARLYGAVAEAEHFSLAPRPAAVEWRDAAGLDELLAGCRLLMTF